MLAKSFPRKQVCTNNFHQEFFGRRFYMVANSFPRKQVTTKNVHQTFLIEIFLLLQNHFLENRLPPKIFINFFFGWKLFMFGKSFPRKHVPTKISSKILWSIIFYGCRIISSKSGSYQKFSWKIFIQTFLWMQNYFIENRFLPNIFIKHFLVEMF